MHLYQRSRLRLSFMGIEKNAEVIVLWLESFHMLNFTSLGEQDERTIVFQAIAVSQIQFWILGTLY